MELRKLAILDIVLFILGVLLVVIGGILFPVLDRKVKSTVEDSVKLVKNSEAFEAWLNPPAPIYISFYFFNVTNADEVVQNNSKPQLKEYGPFTYREYRNKTNVQFSANGSEIHYKEHKYYVFDESSSSSSDSFVICTINIPILTLATQLRFYPAVLQLGLELALMTLDETLIQCHTVKELLWGYTPKSVQEINHFLEEWGLPYKFNYTFGIYSGPTANGTDDGDIAIYSGAGNVSDLGLIVSWRGNSSLSYWHGSCNRIDGSDGTLWHPFINPSETLYIFNADICRSVYVRKNATADVSSSRILTYSFIPPPTVMEDPHEYPDNRCYCSPYADNGTFCLHGGVLNVTSCRQNAPIIMSQPHFYEAPAYVHRVEGLNPDSTKHQTILNVEPITGLTLKANKRIQVNMFVQNLQGLKDTRQITDPIIFPISWVDEHALIPDDEASKFYNKVILPMKVADGVKYGLLALGALLLLCALVLLVVILFKRTRTAKDSTLLTETDDPMLT